ncbi:MAG: phosphotransferase enzyme family protein [Pseudonocardiaceae bacterium]
MKTAHDEYRQVLADACAQAGLNDAGAQAIRIGENAIFRLSGRVVIRIARPGQLVVAAKEIRIARWLAHHDVPAIRAVEGVPQPLEITGRAVTFWEALPPHRHGTPAEVADALRRLHDLPVPTEFTLAPLAPFTRLAQRINAATTLSAADRSWLRDHLTELQHRYATLPQGIPCRVIHGDAWVGNVVTTNGGHTVLLDLERCSIGPPEWDLVSTAIKHTSLAWVSTQDYQDFCRHYGHDVTTWHGFELLRDIRELRMTCYLAQHATEQPCARSEAELRVACLRGDHGPRPWNWTPAL